MSTITYPKIATNGNDFYILGEMHGVAENAEIALYLTTKILEAHQGIGIAFEWEISPGEIACLQKFIDGETTQVFETNPVFFSDSDNRAMTSHVILLKALRALVENYQKKITVFAFGNVGADYESDMANNLQNCKEPFEYPILVITGVMHGKIGDNDTLASKLSKQFRVINFFINYLSGSVEVDGETYNITDAASQQDSTRQFYKHTITVVKATPDRPIIDNF